MFPICVVFSVHEYPLQTASLAALLSQLTHLTYTLPTPHRYILVDNEIDAEEDGAPRILAVICSIIQDHVRKLGNHETEKSDLGILAKESLVLLEALCWDTPSDLENRSWGPFVFSILG
jgi:hypothetical protein